MFDFPITGDAACPTCRGTGKGPMFKDYWGWHDSSCKDCHATGYKNWKPVLAAIDEAIGPKLIADSWTKLDDDNYIRDDAFGRSNLKWCVRRVWGGDWVWFSAMPMLGQNTRMSSEVGPHPSHVSAMADCEVAMRPMSEVGNHV